MKFCSISANLYCFLRIGTIFSDINSILWVTLLVNPKSCCSNEKQCMYFYKYLISFCLLCSDMVYIREVTFCNYSCYEIVLIYLVIFSYVLQG